MEEVKDLLYRDRCTPKHFLERGFEFEFPQLRGALEDLFPGD